MLARSASILLAVLPHAIHMTESSYIYVDPSPKVPSARQLYVTGRDVGKLIDASSCSVNCNQNNKSTSSHPLLFLIDTTATKTEHHHSKDGAIQFSPSARFQGSQSYGKCADRRGPEQRERQRKHGSRH